LKKELFSKKDPHYGKQNPRKLERKEWDILNVEKLYS
jgi:hypothetical protein